MTESTEPIGYLLSDDLMFTSRITATARGLSLQVKVAPTVAGMDKLIQQQVPACVLLDLGNPSLDVAAFVPRLRQACPSTVRVVAYGSHVDTATLRAAREAGCDVVWPRSKFVQALASALPAWFAS